MSEINTANEAKKHIGKRLFWNDVSNRYSFLRSGILDDVYRNQLSFDGNQDYRSINNFTRLRTTEEDAKE